MQHKPGIYADETPSAVGLDKDLDGLSLVRHQASSGRCVLVISRANRYLFLMNQLQTKG
jgi:hypothetical protein